jgi:hypothetical protein
MQDGGANAVPRCAEQQVLRSISGFAPAHAGSHHCRTAARTSGLEFLLIELHAPPVNAVPPETADNLSQHALPPLQTRLQASSLVQSIS